MPRIPQKMKRLSLIIVLYARRDLAKKDLSMITLIQSVSIANVFPLLDNYIFSYLTLLEFLLFVFDRVTDLRLKPFSCPYCSSQFGQKSHMKAHMSSKHGHWAGWTANPEIDESKYMAPWAIRNIVRPLLWLILIWSVFVTKSLLQNLHVIVCRECWNAKHEDEETNAIHGILFMLNQTSRSVCNATRTWHKILCLAWRWKRNQVKRNVQLGSNVAEPRHSNGII